MYQREYGHLERKLIAASQEKGVDIPASIKDKPILPSSMFFFYKAFDDLCTVRYGGKITKVPEALITYFDIRRYANDYNVVGAYFEFFKLVMYECDLLYIHEFKE